MPAVAIGLLMIAGLLAFGILIYLKKDNTTTTIEVPEGSTARVDAQGGVTLELPTALPSGSEGKANADKPSGTSRSKGPAGSPFVASLDNGVAVEMVPRASETAVEKATQRIFDALESPTKVAKTFNLSGRKEEAGHEVPKDQPLAEDEVTTIEGWWDLVRVEKGRRGDESWAAIFGQYQPIDPATTSRFVFDDLGSGNPGLPGLSITRLGPAPESWGRQGSPLGGGWFSDGFTYRIDPDATPKTVDLIQGLSPSGQPAEPSALGIYDIQGDQLKICLATCMPAIKHNRPPKSFSPRPESGEVLFVLRRHRLSDDEKAMQGHWNVGTRVRDGRPEPREKLKDNSFWISSGGVTIWEGQNQSESGAFTLDTAKQPKEITIILSEYEQGKEVIKRLCGIYEYHADRLTIAYRQGGPPPQKFESTPGSGVTLLVLEWQDMRAGGNGTDMIGVQAVPAAATHDHIQRAIVANLKANERLYSDIDVVITDEYVDSQRPQQSDAHFQPTLSHTGVIHYVKQQGMFHLDIQQNAQKLNGNQEVETIARNRLRLFDGTTSRTLESTEASIVAGPTLDSSMISPHMLIIQPAGYPVPLSTYLEGDVPMRAHRGIKVDPQTHIAAMYLGDEVVDGLSCHKVAIEHIIRPAGILHSGWVLWLARDRNYLPIQCDGYTYSCSNTVRVGHAVARDLREIVPGVWFPHEVVITAYNSDTVRQHKRQEVGWRECYTVKSVSLAPHYPDTFFRDLEIPDGTPVRCLDEQGKTVRRYVQGKPQPNGAASAPGDSAIKQGTPAGGFKPIPPEAAKVMDEMHAIMTGPFRKAEEHNDVDAQKELIGSHASKQKELEQLLLRTEAERPFAEAQDRIKALQDAMRAGDDEQCKALRRQIEEEGPRLEQLIRGNISAR
jgi:uncharacterized protein (TIGR03067 family)